MSDTTRKYLLLAVRVFLTLAFAAAGLAKLMGVQMLVDEFALIGVGQWFRYVTGIIEVGAAILLWVPGFAAYAAGLMVCVVLGALVAHAAILGMATSPPAMLLGVLALLTLYANRAQLQR